MTPQALHRHIGLFALVIYGVGDILGAGIYALIGKAAGEMGNGIWMAFLASMVAAGLTGLSYASLGSRYPRAGGASFFTHHAFKSNFLAYVIGLAALSSGVTSMAAGSRAFAGYFTTLVSAVPVDLVVVTFCLVLAGVVIRGIRESMWMNMLCTGIELGGLLLVISVGAKFIGSVDYTSTVTVANPAGDLSFSLILSGAVLTFYSFVGFEDIINVSEEVKNPESTMPKGILLAVLIASTIYVTISLVAVSVIPAAELATSSAPLVDVVKRAAPWFPPIAFAFIAMFAVANTALLNFIMGSRLIYGMANQGLMPKVLGKVSRRRTPYVSSLAVLGFMLVLALTGNIASLARATSVLLLICFMMVNLALVVLKYRKGEPKGRFEIPAVVPVLGTVVCALMLSYAKIEEIKVAGAILVVIVILYFVIRPASISSNPANAD
ncbi:amino acid permease [Cellvibrio zantedeschiae]|uniref:Amino acid permease n=1 Tax=Cellvibrio zantedeschiae TaxID=1237077 RepID=A0ABQ3B0J5_9GAMM|nr:amino acid permease [Cellvibrio zantedeschiae]GGY72660.1 amino acid permease [Cellvibrio zantedeschiae]